MELKLSVVVILFSLISCNSDFNKYYDNYKVGMSNAKENNSEIFVIFDLYGASNQNVQNLITNKRIANKLKKYTVIRLMCDDRTKLNDTLTVGAFNSALQKKISGETYQPMFLFLDREGRVSSSPIGYCEEEEMVEYIENYDRLNN